MGSLNIGGGIDVIGNFIESGKFGLHSRVKLDLLLADSFDALPNEVRKAAEDAGGTKDNTYAVLHKDAPSKNGCFTSL